MLTVTAAGKELGEGKSQEKLPLPYFSFSHTVIKHPFKARWTGTEKARDQTGHSERGGQ